jgi:hypothetical protein
MSDRQGSQLHGRKMQALLINELLKGFQNMSDRANVPTSSSCATVPLPKRRGNNKPYNSFLHTNTRGAEASYLRAYQCLELVLYILI